MCGYTCLASVCWVVLSFPLRSISVLTGLFRTCVVNVRIRILIPIAAANIILKRMKRIYSAFKIQLEAAAYIMGFKDFSLDFLRNCQRS